MTAAMIGPHYWFWTLRGRRVTAIEHHDGVRREALCHVAGLRGAVLVPWRDLALEEAMA